MILSVVGDSDHLERNYLLVVSSILMTFTVIVISDVVVIVGSTVLLFLSQRIKKKRTFTICCAFPMATLGGLVDWRMMELRR